MQSLWDWVDAGRLLPEALSAGAPKGHARARVLPKPASMKPYVPYHTVERLRYKAGSVNGYFQKYFWLCKYRNIRHLRVILELLSRLEMAISALKRGGGGLRMREWTKARQFPESDGLPTRNGNIPPDRGRGGWRGRRRWNFW